MPAIPYLLTFAVGFLAVISLFKTTQLSLALLLSFSFLLGMVISIFICFFSFIFMNSFNLFFIVTIHAAIIIVLFFKNLNLIRFSNNKKPSAILPALVVFCTAGLIAYIYAIQSPYGGWDAWQVWNFKAKFLLLAGDRWKELFDPILWRSSPHYPLALPLWTAWTWAFTKNTPWLIPLWNSILFNIMTAGLLFGFLRQEKTWLSSVIPALFLFTIPFYMTLATSQYADIFIGIYLLGTLGSLYTAFTSSKKEFIITAGIFTSLLSFIKPEGAVLSVIIVLTATAYLSLNGQRKNIKLIPLFWLSALIAGLPSILFQLFLSPGNQTFINGLVSASHPSTLLRLKTILAYFIIEISRIKWGFLWLLLFLSALLNLNRIFKKQFFIFPVVVVVYLFIVFSYYWINTQFAIEWWLAVSLSRILSTLAPAMILWISLAFIPKKSSSL